MFKEEENKTKKQEILRDPDQFVSSVYLLHFDEICYSVISLTYIEMWKASSEVIGQRTRGLSIYT